MSTYAISNLLDPTQGTTDIHAGSLASAEEQATKHFGVRREHVWVRQAPPEGSLPCSKDFQSRRIDASASPITAHRRVKSPS